MRVFGVQFVLSTEEQGLWWDSDQHHALEAAPTGKPGWGIKLALRGGDVVHPSGVADQKEGDPDWRKSVWWNPAHVWCWKCPVPVLPFLSVALGPYGFYLGAKDYPLHHDNYLRWLPPEDVYAGSRALCFSASIRKTRVI